MQRLLLSIMIILSIAGCGQGNEVLFGEPLAGDEIEGLNPQRPERPLFRVDALPTDAGERGYVVGHALSIALYSRTLPRYIDGTGFRYRPGVSSGEARVVYAFAEVVDEEGLEAGGDCVPVEGAGEICPEGEPDPLEDGEDIGDVIDEDGELSDEDPAPGENTEDGDNEPQEPTPEDPFIDDDCETFLDPAAVEARALSRRIDAGAVLRAVGVSPVQLALALEGFEQGRVDALALEDLDEDTDYSEPEELKDEVQEEGLCDHSPLILDLNGDGIDAGDPRRGVMFDLKQTGSVVRTAWPSGDDALLVLDRNNDGAITDGGELFGNTKRFANGFATLSELDQNNDGIVDAKDPMFTSLRLWRDANRDGKSAPRELVTLAGERVTALATAYVQREQRDAHGNDLSMQGSFFRGKERGTMIDVWFRIQSAALTVARR